MAPTPTADDRCTDDSDPLDEDQRRRIEAKIGPSETFDSVEAFVEDAVDHALYKPIPGGGPVLAPDSGDESDDVDERPTVPVFYNVPRRAADRAVERFETRREQAKAGVRGKYLSQTSHLMEYIFEEVREVPVIYVGGEALGDYASDAGVESMVIEPDELDE